MLKSEYEKWEDLNWPLIEVEVFKMQKRIFRKSKENSSCDVHNLQQALVRSWFARCLAVRKAAEDSPGRSTAGVDMLSNPTDPQKLKLARQLTLRQRPKPVRRVWIPKPGSRELRPLGIPTIADRALQHLIALALEPEWEAKFSAHTYGFRRGHGCHDALTHIRRYIRRSPRWVLDADIEKFFDRLDHSALLEKLNTWPHMKTAIRRILQSGVTEGVTIDPTEKGTPQGGPLSPLLANIALTGLEAGLEGKFPKGSMVEGTRLQAPPRIVIYADDFIVMHGHKAVVEATQTFIQDWLKPYGLNLSPTKTRITHTLDKVDGQQAGFDFLGCRVQQFRVGRHAVSPYFKGLWTDIRPSRKSVKTVLQKLRGTISKMSPHKRRNAAYQLRASKGKAGPVELMIIHMNRIIRGWSGYHRNHNAKRVFSRIDHELFHILWAWAKRTYPRRGRRDLVKELFNGGHPWRFGIKQGHAGRPVELLQVASTEIQRHNLIQAGRSYYDGDWAYWGKRQGRYPGLPSEVGRLLKWQGGKCATCLQGISAQERVSVARIDTQNGEVPVNRQTLHHERCSERLDQNVVRDPFADSRC